MAGHEHAGLLTDEVLLHNVAHGCEGCFDLLFLRFFRPVLNLAYKIIRDRSEAEYIVQEVCLSTHEQRERFDPSVGSARTWVLQLDCRMNRVTPSPAENINAILWGGFIAGVLDAVDGVVAYGFQGLNPIQVLQYIASGLLGPSSFQGGLAPQLWGQCFTSSSPSSLRRSTSRQAA